MLTGRWCRVVGRGRGGAENTDIGVELEKFVDVYLYALQTGVFLHKLGDFARTAVQNISCRVRKGWEGRAFLCARAAAVARDASGVLDQGKRGSAELAGCALTAKNVAIELFLLCFIPGSMPQSS